MIKITEIINDILIQRGINETITDASREANARGYKYAGFGRWKNNKGEIVAKTHKGKLVPFSALSKREPRHKSDNNKIDQYDKKSTVNNKSTHNYYQPKSKRKTKLKTYSPIHTARKKYKKRPNIYDLKKKYYKTK